jgi:DNA-binding NarL/FixJ family response regulator
MTQTRHRIRILVAVDHSLLRGALCDMLRLTPDFEVVAEAGSGDDAVHLSGSHEPDVVLLDIDMLDDEPAPVVRRLLHANPRLRVIVLSVSDDAPTVLELLDLGVSGYLHKSVSRSALVSAIRNVQEDDERVTLSLSRQKIRAARTVPSPQPPRPREPAGPPPKTLSSREIEILACVGLALSNRQIAVRLGITEGTVKQHLRNIFTKLGAVSRIDAVNKAILGGLIPAPTGQPTGRGFAE